MGRLTYRNAGIASLKHGADIVEVIERLAEYEDAYEAGFPCKIGENVYRVVEICEPNCSTSLNK